MKTRLAVIIPFFQRRPGILQKAIRSAFSQKETPAFDIIIVDDLSPVSAAQEVSCFSRHEQQRIQIVRQEKNGGPGAARNRGLDSVKNDVEYVAFLDSDDEWSDSHLSNAYSALDGGYDFYFADFFQLDQIVSAFDRAKRIVVKDHPRVNGESYLRQYSGDMFNQVLTGNIIGTSTVVYRYSKFPRLRFRTEYRYAGEDYLFWLELSRLTNKIAFSTERECNYGHGVNIYSGSSWGSDTALECIHDDMKYRQFVIDELSPTREQVEQLSRKIRELRYNFARNLLHNLLRRKAVRKELLYHQLRTDPQLMLAFAPVLLQTCVSGVTKLARPLFKCGAR